MIEKLADAADIVAAPVVVLALVKVGTRNCCDSCDWTTCDCC
jgi:hypothetical protein